MVRYPFVMVGPSAPTAPLCQLPRTPGTTSQPHIATKHYRRNLPVIAGQTWQLLCCHNLPNPERFVWQVLTALLCQVSWKLLDRPYRPVNDLVSVDYRYRNGDLISGEK